MRQSLSRLQKHYAIFSLNSFLAVIGVWSMQDGHAQAEEMKTAAIYSSCPIRSGEYFTARNTISKLTSLDGLPKDAILTQKILFQRRAACNLPTGHLLCVRHISLTDQRKWTRYFDERDIEIKDAKVGYQYVLSPLKDLPEGTLVSPIDLAAVQIERENVPGDAVKTYKDAFRKRTKKYLYQGSILRKSELNEVTWRQLWLFGVMRLRFNPTINPPKSRLPHSSLNLLAT